ncbi:hypothetical protein [Thermophilibacter provencensis]|uniref:hypothetical protein n=1 Tax=Thermophilibacter provencensis TaxID=1852386 RepID=UPI00094AB2C1|nr:hypothetical protein [Thermophilibacter provencensis]
MGYSRSDPHRPCLREHSYGGSEVWFTNIPEGEGCFDTLDEDVGRAVADLRRLAGEVPSRTGDASGKGREQR